jgi:hypothetical protein
MSPRGRILSLQEERAKTYEEWEIAFKSYIVAGAKEEPYAQVWSSPNLPAHASPATTSHFFARSRLLAARMFSLGMQGGDRRI